MQLSESIRTAWEAVEASGVPEQVQQLAFATALESLLRPVSQVPPADSRQAPSVEQLRPAHDEGGSEQEPTNVAEQVVVQRVSAETGVPVEKLEAVFHIDGEIVKLIGPHSKFGSSTADQARSVARIVTVVRKLGMGHSDTPFETLKDACESKHCYDSKNFASQHLPKIDGFVVKGEGRARRLEAKGLGISSFSELIDRVLGLS